MMTFDVANILTSMIFIKRVKAICGSKQLYWLMVLHTIRLHAEFLT